MTMPDSYRYPRFHSSLILDDLRFSRKALRPGETLPDLEVTLLDGQIRSLRSLGNGLPIVLVTGSASCHMTTQAMPGVNRMVHAVAGLAVVALVQVRQAHPGSLLPQAADLGEKRIQAKQLQSLYDFAGPVIVDDEQGTLHRRLDTKPNSVHLLSPRGELLFRVLWAGDEAGWRGLLTTLGGQRGLGESQRMLAPVVSSFGYAVRTWKRAGPDAVRDVWRGAPPVALLGAAADALGFASESRRGPIVMAMLVALLMVAAVGAVALFQTW